MNRIDPINPAQQEQVITETRRYIQWASELFKRHFEPIPVVFDLKGRAAGMYKIAHRTPESPARVIRYNPYIFSKYFSENLSSTVPHEVAHYVTDMIYGLKQVRPHGIEWRNVMTAFGVEAKRTGDFDLEGIPVRQYRRYGYRCGCDTLHMLTSRRHNKIAFGKARYICRCCGATMRFVQNVSA